MAELSIRPATRDRWDDLVALFERPGPRGGRQVTQTCWCMFWRVDRKTFSSGWAKRGAGNRAALERLAVDEERVTGLLAYAGDDPVPVGWVSVAPREEFPRLESSRSLARVDDTPGVWSVVCFFVHRANKKQGVGDALLRAATDYALSQGARIVEGYASRPGDHDPFTGFESMFARAGFQKVREGERRSTWRYEAPTSPVSARPPVAG